LRFRFGRAVGKQATEENCWRGWSRCADTSLQKLLASVWFDLITVGAIFLNCVTLAMTDPLCEGTLPDNL
jgi:hypothetical protein